MLCRVPYLRCTSALRLRLLSRDHFCPVRFSTLPQEPLIFEHHQKKRVGYYLPRNTDADDDGFSESSQPYCNFSTEAVYYDPSGCLQEKSTLTRRIKRLLLETTRKFLPKDYPASVSDNYLPYVQRQLSRTVASCISGVLSTQALLYAVGVGAGSVPLAGALNWVIKDGIGLFGGVVFANSVKNFDSDPKRWSFRSAIMLEFSTLMEVLTPAFPTLFLPLAAAANIGKNAACVASSAANAAIHQSFARHNNLADVTAKTGSQMMLASLCGTGLGIALSPVIGSSCTPVLSAVLFLNLFHMLMSYSMLKRVIVNKLNYARAEQLALEFLSDDGVVLSAASFRNHDKFVRNYRSPLKSSLNLSSSLISHFPQHECNLVNLEKLLRANSGSQHLVSVSAQKRRVNLSFFKDASSDDILLGLLHATHVRKFLDEVSDIKSLGNISLLVKITESLKYCQGVHSGFLHELSSNGWNTEHLFLERKAVRLEIP